MKLTNQHAQLQKLFGQRNTYMLIALGNIVLSICLIFVVLILSLRTKIEILVPPQINKSFWVSGEQVSPQYLDEMSRFIADLRFNLTPESSATQRETLLRYTDPTFYNEFKALLIKEADYVAEQHISIAFYPTQDIRVDAKRLKTIVEGDLKSSVGDTAIPAKHVKYLLLFKYNYGRLFIKQFQEIKNA